MPGCRERSCLLGALVALAACSGGGSSPVDPPPEVSAAPGGGVFAAPVAVTLSCVDDAGECEAVWTTIDGSEPGPASPRYEGPLTIATTTTLRFRGVDRAGNLSAVAAESYLIDGEPPIVSALPPGGLFPTAPGVVLACSDGAGAGCAGIRYTVDGSAPDATSPAYGAPVVVTDGMELRFVAVDAVGNTSAEGRETYRVDSSPPMTTPSPGPGYFAGTVDVALSCDDAGGTGCVAIHYTLDDSAPTELSPVYEAPLRLSATTRLRAAGVDAAGNLEPALAWEYTRDGEPPQTYPSHDPGTYRPPVTIVLWCFDAASGCDGTRYTLDGSVPGPASPRYEEPIALLATTTLRFASVDAVGNAEPPGEAHYVVDGLAPLVTATPPGGTFGAPLTVSLSCDDGAGSGCAAIRYTLDPSLGEAFWPLYGGPIALAQSGTLRFAAVDAAGNVAAASESYVIDTLAPRLVSATPPAGAGAVEPDALPALTFDEALVADGLVGTVNGVPAAVTLDLAGRTVTVTPAGPLALDAEITVSLSGVRDAFGHSQAQPVELSFRTRGDVLPLSPDGSATLTLHDLAYDAAGNAVAVFVADTGKVRKTMATRFDAASGSWGPEVELHRDVVALHSVARPVAVASNGSGFLVAWSTAAPTAKARFIDGKGVVGPELALFGTAHLQGVASNGKSYVVAVMTPTGMAARAWDGSLWALEQYMAPQGVGFKLLGDATGYFGAFQTSGDGAGAIWTVSSTSGLGWGNGVVYSGTPAPSMPAIAVGPGGARAVAFTTSGAVGGVFATFGVGGALPAAALIANGNQPANASVAVSSGGVAVAWQALVDGGVATSVRIHAAGAWGAEEALASGSGTPGGTRLASDGPGYLALASSGAGGQILRAYEAGSWGSALAPLPAGAQTSLPLVLLGRPFGYVLAFARDDGARHRLSTRVHTGKAVDAALGAITDVPAAQHGSARELRLAADGFGGSAVVWTQEHRGGPAVFASMGRNGAFDPPVLVALGADSPAVASNGAGFVVVYRRGTACESVRLDGESAAAPMRLDDGSGTCSMPGIASDGTSYVAGWRAKVGWMYRIEAAVGDGETWGPGVTLHSDNYFDTELDLGAYGGTFAAAYDLGGSVLFSSSDDAGATFGAPREVDPFVPDDGPRLAVGPAGFGLFWTHYTNVYGVVAPGGVFPWGPTMITQLPEHCGAPAIVAGPVGFLSAFDCRSPYVVEWANGWKPMLRLSTVAAGGIRLASSPRGFAIVYAERSAEANLRGGVRVDGAWQLATVRPKVEADPALAWDGEAHVVGWREVDVVDAGVDRVLVRRGL